MSIPTEEIIAEVARQNYNTTRLKTKLADYGYNAQFYEEFDGEINTANALKKNTELETELKKITNEVVSKREICYEWITRAKNFFDEAYPPDSPEQRLFPSDYTAWSKNESLMISKMPELINLIVDHSVALTEKRMPADFVQTGRTRLADLEAANDAQEAKKKTNESETKVRQAAYKNLYKKVNRINKAGRKAYKDDPESLVLFKSPWPGGGDGDEEDDTPEPPVP